MRNLTLSILLFAVCSSLTAQESTTSTSTQNRRRGEAAGYTSRDATVFSVMGWGLLLAGGIVAICVLIPNDTTGGHNH